MQSEYMTVKDVSDKLSVPLRTVYQWIYHGKLPAYKIS
ncbi:MAG: helix-turn-helix domain-containing protein, partial [Oscillospiraceae bacterium]|nr:helix-turn-helix domain-containing protein [Oscillospiraceae bacterium]